MTTRYVLFDIDGTLVDSNDAHARAWEHAFRKNGREVTASQVRPLIGMGGDRVIARFAPDLDSEEGLGKTISDVRLETFLKREIHEVRPFPGVRALVEALRDRGFVCGVATSAKNAERDELLKIANVADLLTEGASSKDAESSKPAPDIVEAALKKLDADPAYTTLIADTRYDIDSAHAAKVRTIILRCGGSPPDAIADAEAIYDDPQELTKKLDSAPFA
jgi:HAD superfamily hydrolase (TIGR01509 family)